MTTAVAGNTAPTAAEPTDIQLAAEPNHVVLAAAEPGRRERIRAIVVLGSLIAIAPLTIDMYLPSLPSITADLHTTATAVQLTLTGTLLGLALGQLLIGPWSDAVGRRRPLIGGLGVHVLASVLCVFAPNIAVLGALRILQGLGAAAATVVATAVVRDLFAGLTAAKVFSRLMLVMGAAPILAPTLGSQVLRLTNWRGVFGALAILGVALIVVAVLTLRETLPPERRQRGGVVATLRGYGSLFHDRVFVGLVLLAGLAMAALFSYVSGSSFVFQEQYGLSVQQFGLVFGAGAAGLIAATQLNVRLLGRFSPQQVLTGALTVGSVAALVLLGVAVTGRGGLVAFLIPLWTILAAAGLSIPNAPALALTRHGEAAGTAAAMLGAIQFGVGAMAAPLVGALGGDGLAMAIVVTLGMLGSLAVLLLVVRPATVSGEEAGTVPTEAAAG
jgi:MFS transporter, DHA1 family, multidrug resistance protein